MLVILLHGDLTTLKNIEFNKGDLIFIVALAIFGLYSVLSLKRPHIHGLSFVGFTFGCGAACLIPLFIWELLTRPLMQLDTANLLTLFYVAVFPSTLAYLCFNRGVQLIGANRAAPFFHVVPVFGAVMAIVFLGEQPQAVPLPRLRAGADRRLRGVAKAQTGDLKPIRAAVTCGGKSAISWTRFAGFWHEGARQQSDDRHR